MVEQKLQMHLAKMRSKFVQLSTNVGVCGIRLIGDSCFEHALARRTVGMQLATVPIVVGVSVAIRVQLLQNHCTKVFCPFPGNILQKAIQIRLILFGHCRRCDQRKQIARII